MSAWRWLRERHARVILAAMLLVLLASPVEDDWPAGHLLLAPAVVLIVLATLLYIRPRRWMFRAALGLAIAWVVTTPGFRLIDIGAIGPRVIMLSINLLTFVMVIGHVVNARRPDAETLSAALAGYLILGAIWAQLYVIAVLDDPGSIHADGPHGASATTLLYFSFQALTTVGFGDVAPIASGVRMMAVVEAAIGQFYIATVIASLASIASRRGE